MSGKDKEYWLSVWDERNYSSAGARADRLLKRYAHLLTGTTYGKEVYSMYYCGSYWTIPTDMPWANSSSKSIEHAVSRLNKALQGRAIKENGDLYQILQVLAEKDGKNPGDYLKDFNIEPRSSLWDTLASFFCCYPSDVNSDKKESESQKLNP